MNDIDKLVAFFNIKDDALKQEFASLFIPKSYAAGENIFEIGHVYKYLYVLRSGVARGYTLSDNGEIETNCFGFRFGEVNSPLPLDFTSPSVVGYEAITNCEMFLLSEESYKRLLAFPEMAGIVTSMLNHSYQIHYSHKIILQNSSAEERYVWFLKNYPGLIDIVPHYHIASYLGMTQVTMSRARTKLHGKVNDDGSSVE